MAGGRDVPRRAFGPAHRPGLGRTAAALVGVAAGAELAHAVVLSLPPLRFRGVAQLVEDLAARQELDRDGDTEIYRRHIDGRLTQLTSNRSHDFGAVWSPDGRRLAFVSSRDGDDEIFVMNADGSGQRQLTRNVKAAKGNPASDRARAWSPDGRRLAFASTRDGGEAQIYRMNADGTGQVRLTRTARHVTDHTPSWSPGGHYIVFSSDRAGFDNFEIYRMRMNGTEVVRLTRSVAGVDENAPEYSPDGRQIIFSSTRFRTQHDLFTMRVDGSAITRLGGDPGLDDVFPKWSPNGRQVTYETVAREGIIKHEDAWMIGADGSGRRKVLGSAANESFPDVRPVVR